jgi:thiol-disulfide isomerase/thioredoxin
MPENGAVVHEFTLTDLDGKARSLSDVVHANKVTVLNFWGIYCPPCRKELAELNALIAEWKTRGIGILTVNLSDTAEDVRKIWNEEGFNMPVLLRGDTVSGLLGLFAIPTTFVLDRKGRVLDTIVGVDMKELKEVVEGAANKA